MLNAEAELTRAQAALKDSTAGLGQARRRLSILGLNGGGFGQYVVVRSPIAGKVLDLQVVRGEFRNDTNAPLITVADLSSVWVTSAIPENSIRWIERGEHVRIELAAYPGEVFTGRVMRVADTVDPQTRAVEVQTELSNRDGRLRPEMFARIRHSHGSRMLPVVPSSAVVQSGGSAWVYVARSDHEFEKVKVVVGEDAGANVPVLSGVNRGRPRGGGRRHPLAGPAGGATVIADLVPFLLRRRAVTLLALAIVAGVGVWAMLHLKLEAYPDLSETQVTVI